jgi:DNA polymerase (family 10)
MPIHNNDVAEVFEEIADLLEIEGANAFRVRAYRNAGRVLRGLSTEVSEMLSRGRDLSELPGIGKDLAGKIAEVVKTGTCDQLKKLRRELPPALTDLLRIPGLGPKRVSALYHELDIHTLPQLQRAAKDGRIRALAGFGAKTEQRILENITVQAKKSQRFKLAVAAGYAESLVKYLQKIDGVDRVAIAGSFRRARETVGDLDILVTAKPKSPVMDRLVAYDEVAKVVAKGSTLATVMLRSGIQVDVRLVPKEDYGAALYYFTGSKAHNIAVRGIAQKRGLKINEYGVFRGDRKVAGETEESVLRAVGLPFIPPELRENRGEIEAAVKGKLPKLVELDDLAGDLHVHTTATDGNNTIREMAGGARKLGLGYIAVTEHSRRLAMAHGLDPKRLRQQMAEIDRLNGETPGLTILKGVEVDILEDGTLDLPDEVLGDLDLVIGAVHSRFNLSREKQTERILRAMDGPHFTMLAHPSGRLIPTREPYDVDMPRIIRAAKDRGCFLELNAHPARLDLMDVYCQMAKSEGVLVSINSDAHGIEDFKNLRFGVGQARRGWLEKADVLNTRPLKSLRPLLKRTMSA